MKIFIIFVFQGSWMPSFTVFIEFSLNVNCVKTITFVMKIFIIFHVPEFMDSFFYSSYRIQFKCILFKDNNICYVNVHHISVPNFMNVFFYDIYRIQFKCKLCKETVTFVIKMFIIFLFQGSWMPSFTLFL